MALPVLSFINNLVDSGGLPLLFLLIALESAGIPLPGETALITASILAGRGHFGGIVPVIVVASAAAILGDNGGYWAARLGLLKWADEARRRSGCAGPCRGRRA